MNYYLAEHAYLPQGWQENVYLAIIDGQISYLSQTPLTEGKPEKLKGLLIPAMTNLHSHAFQRALAGLTEHTIGHSDTFWTWREAMYQLAMRFKPESLKVVAKQLYSEMLLAGYGSVVEFHYLHQPDPLAMSEALIEAALETGIRLTLLPVLYQQGNFKGAALSEGQKRFHLSLDDYHRLLSS
ncbi:MAG: amidohydrolase family protein [Deinococcales bacterium]